MTTAGRRADRVRLVLERSAAIAGVLTVGLLLAACGAAAIGAAAARDSLLTGAFVGLVVGVGLRAVSGMLGFDRQIQNWHEEHDQKELQ